MEKIIRIYGIIESAINQANELEYTIKMYAGADSILEKYKHDLIIKKRAIRRLRRCLINELTKEIENQKQLYHDN